MSRPVSREISNLTSPLCPLPWTPLPKRRWLLRWLVKAGSADRYFQKGCEGNINKLVPEGIVARVPFKGTLSEAVFQLIGGIRSGMGYCGARDIAALQRAQFIRITSNGVTENHPHDVTITSETPNYSRGE